MRERIRAHWVVMRLGASLTRTALLRLHPPPGTGHPCSSSRSLRAADEKLPGRDIFSPCEPAAGDLPLRAANCRIRTESFGGRGWQPGAPAPPPAHTYATPAFHKMPPRDTHACARVPGSLSLLPRRGAGIWELDGPGVRLVRSPLLAADLATLRAGVTQHSLRGPRAAPGARAMCLLCPEKTQRQNRRRARKRM